MDNKQARELLKKYLADTASDQEEDLVESWFLSLKAAQDNHGLPEGAIERNTDEVWKVLENHLPKQPLRLWPRIAVAASIVLVAFAGLWFFLASHQSGDRNNQPDYAVNDIAPGKNGATITLASGQVIQLDSAKSGVVIGDQVSYSDGSDVRYSSGSRSSGPASPGQSSTGPVGVHSLTPFELQGAGGRGQMLTASTARGQTYQFVLPDGTKVWLNAASGLKFPSVFKGKDRVVELTGEAYLEVAKDKTHPFIVQTEKQQVEVLGTHFNIQAYADDTNTRTTLLEGSVHVVAGVGSKTIKPNEEAILSGNVLKVEQVNAEDAIAWKEGRFVFNDEPLESIMKKLARWYNVEVEYQDVNRTERVGGGISRYDNISEILKQLELTKHFHFKIEGRRVTVMK